ncbi:MAG: hypothetical protein V1770_00855, partial [bacterium]
MFKKYKKNYYLKFVYIIFIVSIFLVAYFFIIKKKEVRSLNDNDEKIIRSARQFNRQMEPLNLGPLVIGGEMPGGLGDTTFAPYIEIPTSKFYVSIAEPDMWCINEYCNIEGGFIQTMGGWLEIKHTGDPTLDEFYGLDLPENKNVKSVVLIGDSDGKIAGIYPNRGLKDVITILKLHPDLANFGL